MLKMNKSDLKTTERRRRKTRFFTQDVRSLLYAFGDVEDPLPETVNVVEDILINYIIDTCHDAAAFAKTTNRQKIKVDDFRFALRKDPIKNSRVHELLSLQKIITDARRQFDNTEGKSVKNVSILDDDDDQDDQDLGNDKETSMLDSQGAEGGSGKNLANSNTNTDTKKRKYNKDGSLRKPRKPYKKRAKKGDQQATKPETSTNA